MSEYREFTGKTVEEALRLAREAFGAELNDLDFEILTPGSRGVLGMGAEPARIVAAPRAATTEGPARTTVVRARTTDHARPEARAARSVRLATALPAATTALPVGRIAHRAGTTAAARRPTLVRPTCRPPRQPRSRQPAAHSLPSTPTSRRRTPRPRRSRQARRSWSS